MITNIVGLIAAVLGDMFYWWIDPVGAIVLAVYTIVNWSGTVLENAGSCYSLISVLKFNIPYSIVFKNLDINIFFLQHLLQLAYPSCLATILSLEKVWLYIQRTNG